MHPNLPLPYSDASGWLVAVTIQKKHQPVPNAKLSSSGVDLSEHMQRRAISGIDVAIRRVNQLQTVQVTQDATFSSDPVHDCRTLRDQKTDV